MSFTTFGDGSGFKLGVSTMGAWARIADGERKLFLEAQWKALKGEGDKIKEVARDSVRQAKIRGARRMATSWRGDIFPKKPPPFANRPAYVLGTNASMPLDHLESGITISGKGVGLMVPIGEAARFKQPAFTEQAGRLARTIAAMRSKYGKLSWLRRRGHLFYGAWTRNRAGKDRFVALFVVVKSVTIPKKLDTRAAILRAARGVETRVAERTMQLFIPAREAMVARETGRAA